MSLPFSGQRRSIAAVGSIYVALRVWSFAGIAGHASSFTDTSEYQAVATLPVFSLDFWTWYKPWGAPLLWKLLPGPTDVSAPIGQWLVSVTAWILLALVVFSVLDHPAARLAGFALVLAFSLVPAVAVWDGALLTESLALSLAALLLAASLWFVQVPTWRRALALILVSFLLAGTRAPNGYLAPFVLVPLAAVTLRRSPRAAATVASASLAIASMTYATSNVRQWEIALAEIVAGRILHQPSAEAYFIDRGMPVRPNLEAELWAHRLPPYRTFQSTPTLAWFLPWFNRDARSTYRGYLLSHPDASIVDPIRDLPAMVAPSSSPNELQGLPLSVYPARGYRSSIPGWLSAILYPASPQLMLPLAAMSIVLLAGLAALGLGRAVWTIPLFVLLSSIPHAIILWDGSDTSIGRHALLLAVWLRLSVFIALLFVLDGWLRRHSPSIGGRRRSSLPVTV
jgi:hypothetical protein